jgi:HAD superfamily hydrolase (TIGR01509 family)
MDLGGVYFTDGTKIALEKMRKIVKASDRDFYSIFKSLEYKEEGWLYRKGMMTREEFWARAKKKLKINDQQASDLELIWHSSYQPNPGMKKLVRDLRKLYKVIAFSVNIRERMDFLEEKYLFKEEFDKLILSYEAGFSKDEPEFFYILADELGHSANQAVLVEDHDIYFPLARRIGINIIHFKEPEQLKKDLAELGVQL